MSDPRNIEDLGPKAIVIGGSAGSFKVVSKILSEIADPAFKLPIILCLHRLKTVEKGFAEALSLSSRVPVTEPLERESIKPGKIYLAPANQHLLVEYARVFALSSGPEVCNSRPAIDLTFESVAKVYRQASIAILLTGANKDGANGMKAIRDVGGYTIVQDPEEAEIRTMPEAALRTTTVDKILTIDQIIEVLRKFSPEFPSFS